MLKRMAKVAVRPSTCKRGFEAMVAAPLSPLKVILVSHRVRWDESSNSDKLLLKLFRRVKHFKPILIFECKGWSREY